MNLMWVIYFADVAGNVSGFLRIMGVGTLVVSAVIFFFCFMIGMEFNQSLDRAKAVARKTLLCGAIPAFLVVVVSTIIPSKQTIYLMATAKVAEDIVTSPEAKVIGSKLYKLLNDKLDEQLKDAKP